MKRHLCKQMLSVLLVFVLMAGLLPDFTLSVEAVALDNPISGVTAYTNDTVIIGGESFKILDNNFIVCYISLEDGSFTVLPKTAVFDPTKPRSYASFRIDGTDYAFGRQYADSAFLQPNVDEDGIAEAVWSIGGFAISQYLVITEDVNHKNSYAVKIAYAAEYFSGEPTAISARILVDTQLGENDDLPLTIMDSGDIIDMECTIYPLPNEMYVSEETSDEYAKAFFVNHEEGAVAKFAVVADLTGLSSSVYDYKTTSPQALSIVDSAVAIYFDEQAVEVYSEEKPDNSVVAFKTNYGYYNLDMTVVSATDMSIAPALGEGITLLEEFDYYIGKEFNERFFDLTDFPTGANAGDIVTFRLDLQNPDAMAFTGGVTFTSWGDNRTTITLTPSNGVYSFVMPVNGGYVELTGDPVLKPGWVEIGVGTPWYATYTAELSPYTWYGKKGTTATITISGAFQDDEFDFEVQCLDAEYGFLQPFTLTAVKPNETYTFTIPNDENIERINIEVKNFSANYHNISRVIAPTDKNVNFSISAVRNGVWRAVAGEQVTVYKPTYDSGTYQSAKIIIINLADGSQEYEFKNLTQDNTFTMPDAEIEIRLELTAYDTVTVNLQDENGDPILSDYASYTITPTVPKIGDNVTIGLNMFNGVTFRGNTSNDIQLAMGDSNREWKFTMPGNDVEFTFEFNIPPGQPAIYSIYTKPLTGDGELRYGINVPPNWEAGQNVTWNYYNPEGLYGDDNPWKINKIYYVDSSGNEVELTYNNGVGNNNGTFVMPDYPITIIVDGGKYPNQIKTECVYTDSAGKEFAMPASKDALYAASDIYGANKITEAMYGQPIYFFGYTPRKYTFEKITVSDSRSITTYTEADEWDGRIQAYRYSGISMGSSDITIKAYYKMIDPVTFTLTGCEADTELKATNSVNGGRTWSESAYTGSDGTKYITVYVYLSYPYDGVNSYALQDMAGLKLTSEGISYKNYEYTVAYTGQTAVNFTAIKTAMPQIMKIDSMVVNHTNVEEFNRINIYGSGFVDAVALDNITGLAYTYPLTNGNTTSFVKFNLRTSLLTVVNDSYMYLDIPTDFPKQVNYSYTLSLSWKGKVGQVNYSGFGQEYSFRLYNSTINITTPGRDPITGEPLSAPLTTHIGIAQLKGTNNYTLIGGSSSNDIIADPTKYSRILMSMSCSDGFTISGNSGSVMATVNDGTATIKFNNGLVAERGDTSSKFTVSQPWGGVKVVGEGYTLRAGSIPVFTPTPLGGKFEISVQNGQTTQYSTDVTDVTTKGARQLVITMPGYTPSIDLDSFGGIGAKYSAIGFLDNAVNLVGEVYVKLPDVIAENPLANIDIKALVLGMNKTPISFDGIIAEGSFDTTPFLVFSAGGKAYAMIDTFNDVYQFEVDAQLKIVEFSGLLHLRRSERLSGVNGGNPIVIPDNFEFGIASPAQGIPLIPVYQVGELNGVTGGIYNIVDTIDFDITYQTIPPIKIMGGAAFSLLEVLSLKVKFTAGLASLKMELSGGVTVNGFQLEILDEFSADVGLRDSLPRNNNKRIEYYYAVKIKLALVKGIINVIEGGGEMNITVSMISPDVLALKAASGTYSSIDMLWKDIELMASLYGEVYAKVYVPSFNVGPFETPKTTLGGINVSLYMYASPKLTASSAKLNGCIIASTTMDIMGVVRATFTYDFSRPKNINWNASLFSLEEEEAALYSDTIIQGDTAVMITIGEGFSVVADTDIESYVPMMFSTFSVDVTPTIIMSNSGKTHTVGIPDNENVYLVAVKGTPSNIFLYDPDGNPVNLNFQPTEGATGDQTSLAYNAILAESNDGVLLKITGAGDWIIESNEAIRTAIVSGPKGTQISNVVLDNQNKITFDFENLELGVDYTYDVILEKKANPAAIASDYFFVETDNSVTGVLNNSFSGTVTLNTTDLAQNIPSGNYFPKILLYKVTGTGDNATYELIDSASGYDAYTNTNTKYSSINTINDFNVTSAGNEKIHLTFTHNAAAASGYTVGYNVKIFDSDTGQQTTDKDGNLTDYDIMLNGTVIDQYFSVPSGGKEYILSLTPSFTNETVITVAGEEQYYSATGYGTAKTATVNIPVKTPPIITLDIENGRQGIDGSTIYGRSDLKVTVNTDAQSDISIAPYVGTYDQNGVYVKPIAYKTASSEQQLELDFAPLTDFAGRLLVIKATNTATGDTTTQFVTVYLRDTAPPLLLESMGNGTIMSDSSGNFTIIGQTEPFRTVGNSLGVVAQADSFGNFSIDGTLVSTNMQVVISVNDEAGNSTMATITVIKLDDSVKSITLDPADTTSVYKGGTLNLSVTGKLADGTKIPVSNTAVTYTVLSGSGCVSIDSNGVLTAKAVGTATIQASVIAGATPLMSNILTVIVYDESSNSGNGNSSGNSSSSGSSNNTPPTSTTPIQPIKVNGKTVTPVTTKDANGKQVVTIAASVDKNGKIEVVIPKSVFASIEYGDQILVMNAGMTMITFGNDALASINAQATGDITITVAPADKTKLTAKQKAQAGDNPVYDLSVMSNGKSITNFNGNVSVTLPYTLKEGENPTGIVVYYLDDDGNMKTMTNCVYDSKISTVTFTTNHFSLYMIACNTVGFTDVINHWAKNTIEKAAAVGLVSGVGDSKYDPNRSTSRAEFVQMMVNVLEFSKYAGNAAPFDDVQQSAWYYNAIMSAKSAGLLKNLALDGNNFSPNQIITREEMALILANVADYMKMKAKETSVDLQNFKDFDAIKNDYLEELELAIRLGLMSEDGIGGGKFDPKGATTRAQAAQVQMNLVKVLGRVE